MAKLNEENQEWLADNIYHAQYGGISFFFDEDVESKLLEMQQQIEKLKKYNDRYKYFVTSFCDSVPDTPDTHWIYPRVQVLRRSTRELPEDRIED